MTTETDEWMTTDELCSWLKVQKDWVWDNKHKIPHVKLGRQLRFNRAELREWLQAQRG